MGRKQMILVIDGQGGKIGRSLVEMIKESMPQYEVVAVGTNSIATANMLKGGADHAATGENPVLVACRTADVIIGPVGIVMADALMGEVTPAMAMAICQSQAKKILIPINKCNHFIVGTKELKPKELLEEVQHFLLSEALRD